MESRESQHSTQESILGGVSQFKVLKGASIITSKEKHLGSVHSTQESYNGGNSQGDSQLSEISSQKSNGRQMISQSGTQGWQSHTQLANYRIPRIQSSTLSNWSMKEKADAAGRIMGAVARSVMEGSTAMFKEFFDEEGEQHLGSS